MASRARDGPEPAGAGCHHPLMRPLRSLFLWMARNAWLRDTLPRLPFARRAVRRFMPGETVDDAFAAATRLQDEGIGVLFTHLGENLGSLAEADDVAAHYRGVIERDLRRAHPHGRVEVSIKPTQLGLDQDGDACLSHCLALADLAQRARDVVLARHGGLRVHRGHGRALRATARAPRPRRHRDPGVPAPKRRGYRAPPPPPPGHPAREGRL